MSERERTYTKKETSCVYNMKFVCKMSTKLCEYVQGLLKEMVDTLVYPGVGLELMICIFS